MVSTNMILNPATSAKRKLGDDEQDCNKRPKPVGGDRNKIISKLMDEVLAQGPLGELVIILQNENEHPFVTLQNALAYMNMDLTVTRDISKQDSFILQIDKKDFGIGTFNNLQQAKKTLAGEALIKLKGMCFSIEKKRDFVNVTKDNLQASTSAPESSSRPTIDKSSIAHKIMLKMGWTGSGLGAQEQGDVDTIVLCENVNRLGLGSTNLMGEITKKLNEFSKSSNVLTLVFDADFTKEERMFIHMEARKFNLKSKSVGKESRKLTVSKKLTRLDIVRELLKAGGEDGLYKLHIPTNYVYLWEST